MVVGKWLAADCDVYIFDEPTKGVDVGAKQEIFRLINDIAKAGNCVIYATCENSELLSITDRMYVMFDGRITAELETAKTNEPEIMHYATGIYGSIRCRLTESRLSLTLEEFKMQTTSRSKAKLLVDWAAVVILILSVVVFTAMRGTAFFSIANLINILRAMSTVTIFALAATVSMAPDGFDMAAGTLGSFCAYVFASLFLWFNMPLWLSIVLTIVFAMVMYLLNMFLILVCKVPDMLATCALQFVHQGLGLAYTGGGAISAGMSTAGLGSCSEGRRRRASPQRLVRGFPEHRQISLHHHHHADLRGGLLHPSGENQIRTLPVRHGRKQDSGQAVRYQCQEDAFYGRYVRGGLYRHRRYRGLLP